MFTIETGPPRGVEAFPSDEAALVAALRGCQQGLGGLFPNGTAAMYVHADDRVGYEARREQINRLADAIEAGEVTLRREGSA